ncbi:uncharacterized protein LOC126977095 [Leptidea sinapis]|uniref:uncharacterized protein LOC126977095 n=1 Tax=Leptidea sinapis TaxID=189913 RepID=UPI00213FA32E|nr:uncharacterized protein LOC126977095 [Leptidea sinapis]
MNCMRLLCFRAPLKLSSYARKTEWNLQNIRYRRTSPCKLTSPPKGTCFDIRNLELVQGTNAHGKAIRSFLYNHYWPREPSIVSLWMSPNSPYLDLLTDKYSYSGERILAYEYIPRTKERKLVGLCVCNKVYPWMVEELEQWGHSTSTTPERHRIYFIAHCIRSPSLFQKYKVEYIYDVEVLGTAAEVTGQGVGTILLQTVLKEAKEQRHPLVQVIAVSQYGAKICEKVGMKQDWSMKYSDFIDDGGVKVFYPRSPHNNVYIYTKYFDPKLGGELPCLPPF